MGNIFTTGLFRQMLRSATPVALAAMGGLLTGHAGVMNIGMDGMILIGAFVAVAVSVVTGSAALGVLAAILVGVLVFELLKSTLQFLGVDPNYQYILQGVVIVVAIALDIRKYIVKK